MTLPLGTVELALAILCAEFALVALVVPALLLRRARSTARAAGAAQARATDAAEAMLGDVEQAEPARREALATIFASTYNLGDEEVAARVEEFIAREQAFYQVMTSVYLERDDERLKAIPEELTKVISPWIRMTPKNMVAATEVDALSASNDALSQSNDALNAELEETRRSMDELMSEYMKAFHKDAAARAAAAPATVDTGDDFAFGDADVDAGPAEAATAPSATSAAMSEADADTDADTADDGVLGLDEAEAALGDVAAELAALTDDDILAGAAGEDLADDDAQAAVSLDDVPPGSAVVDAGPGDDERVDDPDALIDALQAQSSAGDGAADAREGAVIDVSGDDDEPAADADGPVTDDELASLFEDELAALDASTDGDDEERDAAAA